MQGLGIIRIFFEHLPAAELGVQMSPCAQMAENSLMELKGRGRRGGGLNSLADGLLLATIHDFKRFETP